MDLPASPSEKQSKTPVTHVHSLLRDYFYECNQSKVILLGKQKWYKTGRELLRGLVILAGILHAHTHLKTEPNGNQDSKHIQAAGL